MFVQQRYNKEMKDRVKRKKSLLSGVTAGMYSTTAILF